MNSLYSKGPSNIPEGLTKPTKSFTKHVWLSVIGLILFIGLYLLLTIWFGKLAYNLFTDGGKGTGEFWDIVLGIGFAFLSLFMLKSLFFLNKRQENPLHRYLTEQEEPVLFDYLYKLADEAGAPRPHKIFLTDRVNASVSYDISLINLIFPSKKNLEIGLGAVNVLSLGELKAVLAHEFGHFAQRSMLLGRYVYVAQQIAARIVGKRDFFDKILSGISSFDLRIAWIGWILSILVWAIRSLVETCFRIVMMAERALSREMEFQADLVAVSLTGSDALIHALYKLQIADQAYDNALKITNDALGDKNAIEDLYVLQSNYIQQMSQILDDPKYGKSPEVPSFDAASHRIFTKRKYNPPKMWATHPADNDRENNAKNTYIAADIDNRSSWDLFQNPKALRLDMTARLVKTANIATTILVEEDSIKKQNKKYFDWSFLAPKYHSAFYGRFPYLNFKSTDEIFYDIASTDINRIFDGLYPKELASKINQLKEIEEEKEALLVSQNEVVTAEKRVLYHRGEQIKRSDIPDILIDLEAQEKTIRDEVAAHDKECRNVHYKAAKNLGNGWDEQLKNLNGVLHYAEHSACNLNDCANKFHNILTMVLADGRVTSKELNDVMAISSEYYNIVRRSYQQAESIRLDAELLKKLDVLTFFQLFEKFELPPPTRENINDWVNVIDGWAGVANNALMKLRNVALEELLITEDKVKEAYLTNKSLEAPSDYKMTLVDDYALLMPGMERPIRRKLDFWSRFFIGDGLFHSAAKFGVSAIILVGAIYLGSRSYVSTMYVYNGLSIPITVNYGSKAVDLSPNDYETVEVDYDQDYNFKAETMNGEAIDSLQSDFSGNSKSYIYNVANAGLMVQFPVYYGIDRQVNKDFAKTDKWIGTNADYVFREAPRTLSTSSRSSSIKKTVLQGYSDANPAGILSNMENTENYAKIITPHVLWDAEDSKHMMTWMGMLQTVDNPIEIIQKRLEKHPNEVLALRSLYDLSDSIQKRELHEKFAKISREKPKNSNYYYLATRTMEDENLKDDAFIKGHEKWKKNPWLAFASAYTYAERNEWLKSYNAFKIACDYNPTLREGIAKDAERVRRFVKLTHPGKVSDKAVMLTSAVQYYSDLEKGTLTDGANDPYYAYYLLSEGKTEQAYLFAKKHKDVFPYILRNIAVSDGATKNMIKEASMLSQEEGLDYSTAWSSIALAIQKKRSYTSYLELLKTDIDIETVKRFIYFIKRGDSKNAEKVIEGIDFRTKAHFYSLGVMVMRKKAPKPWKQKMRSLLYVDERPYIR